jgi:hypothetical protein
MIGEITKFQRKSVPQFRLQNVSLHTRRPSRLSSAEFSAARAPATVSANLDATAPLSKRTIMDVRDNGMPPSSPSSLIHQNQPAEESDQQNE